MNQDELADRLITLAPGVTELDPEIITEENNDNPNSDPSDNGFSDDSVKSHNAGYLKDDAGTVYDPAIHETDENGKPKYTKTGKFRKRRGRKSAVENPTQATNDFGYREAGRMSADALFVFGQVCFGEEWKPRVEPELGLNEPEQMTAAFASYYHHSGMKEPPPWVMLMIVVGAYASPRLAMPKTQSRLKRFVNWCGLRLTGWKKVKNKGDE